MALMTVTLYDMLPLHQWLALSRNDSSDEAIGEHSPVEVDSDWMFAASAQAVLVIDANTGLILRANPAASRMLNLAPTALAGVEFLSIFDDASTSDLQRGLAESQSSGSTGVVMARERTGGRPLRAHLSLVRAEPQIYLLARLESGVTATVRTPNTNPESAVMEAIDAAPMGFLIAAADFHVEYANRAFVKMVKAQSQDDVRGSSILRWLRFSAADLSRLSARLSQRQAADLLITLLHPNHGLPQQVEVCAVPVPDGLNSQWGFTVRHLPRLN